MDVSLEAIRAAKFQAEYEIADIIKRFETVSGTDVVSIDVTSLGFCLTVKNNELVNSNVE